MLRKSQSPYSDEQLSEPQHAGTILYEIHRAIGLAALDASRGSAGLSNGDLREIIYRLAYLLNFQGDPSIEGR